MTGERNEYLKQSSGARISIIASNTGEMVKLDIFTSSKTALAGNGLRNPFAAISLDRVYSLLLPLSTPLFCLLRPSLALLSKLKR